MYSGGEDSNMTPYKCLKNCMAQQLHQVRTDGVDGPTCILSSTNRLQRYDKDLVIGLTQSTVCLCGYDYDAKMTAGLVEELTPYDTFCTHTCCEVQDLLCIFCKTMILVHILFSMFLYKVEVHDS